MERLSKNWEFDKLYQVNELSKNNTEKWAT